MDNIWKEIADRVMKKGMEEKDESIGFYPGERTAITGNAMNIINPRREMGMWVFDDEARGLSSEPFVAGIPEIIDAIVEKLELVGEDVRFVFSGKEFPGFQASVKKVGEEFGGGYYEIDKSNIGDIDLPKGWLCPATLLFFATLPEHIYLKIEKR